MDSKRSSISLSLSLFSSGWCPSRAALSFSARLNLQNVFFPVPSWFPATLAGIRDV